MNLIGFRLSFRFFNGFPLLCCSQGGDSGFDSKVIQILISAVGGSACCCLLPVCLLPLDKGLLNPCLKATNKQAKDNKKYFNQNLNFCFRTTSHS